MSEFFKSKRKFGLALSAVFMAITVAVASFAFANRDIAAMVSDPPAAEVDAGEAETTRDTLPEEDGFALGADEVDWPERDGDPVDEEAQPVSLQLPSEMKGSFLVPGTDFLGTRDTTEATIKAEVDRALAHARDLTINTVIVDTVYTDLVIYQTQDAPELSSGFDILGYIVEAARAQGLYVYAIFDTSMYAAKTPLASMLSVGAGSLNKLSANLEEFAVKYRLDGILLDGYQSDSSGQSYASYVNSGGGIGFDNFLRQSPSAIVKSAARTVRKAVPGTPVGLLADAVWENRSANEAGSATTAPYTALSGGNADTKSFVEKGYVDFVAVKAYTTTESQSMPFSEVVSWWAEVARQNDVPLYVVHAANKLFSGEAGWDTSDQLIRQLAEVEDVSGTRGSIFNSLQPLAANNQNLGNNLKKIYKEETAPEQVLTQLEMTKPAQTTYTTADPQVTFTGASDPGQAVTINGKKVTTDASGYFTTQEALKAGLNTFAIKHKGKTLTYNITRKIEVLKSASPMDNITTDGGMTVTITAEAYQDADVYAVVNGVTVPMEIDSSVESEQDRDGFFRNFIGEYTVPAASSESKSLGRIVVYAEYDGEKDSIQAASIKVNKKAMLEDGVPVRVVTDQALTYPPNTLNNVPDSRYYPLPAGAMDYAVGDEIVYKKDGKTYTYQVLASGLRVEAKDITPIADDYPGNNAITGMTVTSEDGFTYVTLKTAQKVSYSVNYSGSSIRFEFHNTTRVPKDMKLSKNPLFSAAAWESASLTLTYAKANTFWGYKGYYDENGNLVLRFNNPPSSLSGARIAIDPGHGGRDIGASGFLADYPESVINKAIAQALANELESRGATVNLMNNDNIEGEQRKKAAEKWNADLFVSIHCNSAPNAKAVGTEVYYFQGFSKTMASNLSSAVSAAYGTTNRGAKASYYHVSLSSQMPSVLVECGFLTNKTEFEKLIKSKNQKKIAAGIADGLASTIKSKATGVSGSGTESVGSSVEAGKPGGTDETEATGAIKAATSVPVEDIYIKPTATVTVGKTTTLSPTYYPEEITDPAVTWKSSKTSVATVDKNGKVTGKKEGTAKITVTSKDTGLSAACEVTVRAADAKTVKVTGVELSDYDITVDKGGTYTLRAEVMPDDATNSEVTWRSNKTSIATVSDTGKVTGVREGTAVITVTTSDGKYKETCNVTVTGQSAGADTSASDSGKKLTECRTAQTDERYYEVNPGISMRLEVYNEFWELIKGGDFRWKSSDTSVATVDRMGNVTAKKVGEAEITASASGYDDLEWSIWVTRDKIAVSGVGLSDRDIEIKKGSSYNLRATFSPVSATNRNVTWSSANTKIATVDSSGKVTGVNPGKTTITVKSRENSKATATCEVVVLGANQSGSSGSIEGFYILYEDYDVPDDGLYFSVGDTGRLTYEYYPSDASKNGVTWESKTPNTVKIDRNGNFECLRKGSATVMITLEGNSRVRANVRINVE